MEPHDSMPYNPDIANVFYRAGYIEHWGRGIEKICKACDELGASRPEYELLGNGLRVRFQALQSALLDKQSATKRQSANHGALNERIIALIKDDPRITQEQLAKELGVGRRTIQREMALLRSAGRIERISGKNNGHWQVQD